MINYKSSIWAAWYTLDNILYRYELDIVDDYFAIMNARCWFRGSNTPPTPKLRSLLVDCRFVGKGVS